MDLTQLHFDLASLRAAYLSGVSVRSVMAEAQQRCATDGHHAFIHHLSDRELEPYLSRLDGLDPSSLPLYGVPFVIKDNIDLAHVPTTAGCPEFAYTPTEHAFVVRLLIEAGAVPVGKTNLDQFATGLNGTRSPYGACKNAFNPDFVSGGSSSGSSVAVAKGWVTFSLGTDTAGSGRVPASFNNLIGMKPTCGLLSSSGMVPACRSLDTITVFALTAHDAHAVLSVASAFDPADPYSRSAEPFGVDFSGGSFRFGVPRAQDLEFFGNSAAAELFQSTVLRLQALGGTPVEIDFTPFLETARLLYEGPWVAERFVAIQDFLAEHAEAVFPPVRQIIEGGQTKTAAAAFSAAYRLKALKRQCDVVWQDMDCLLTPTAGTIYRIADMQADPIRLNSNLGYYTNFMNLLDYCAVAVPAGIQTHGDAAGLPWGVTLAGPAHQDVPLLRLADRLHHALLDTRLGATEQALAGTPLLAKKDTPSLRADTVLVAVCGAHMTGLPLNHLLTSRGARVVEATTSAPVYRFYALAGGAVKRPGMVRVAEGGSAIELEVWELPASAFGHFVQEIPAPLGIGKVVLASGEAVCGFVCEGVAVEEGAQDITAFGGWRSYLSESTAGTV